MSENSTPQELRCLRRGEGQEGRLRGHRTDRGAARWPRPRADGRRHGRAEGDDVRPLCQAPRAAAASRPRQGDRRGVPRDRQRRPDVRGARDPRTRDRPGVLRTVQPRHPVRRDPGRGRRTAAAAGSGQGRRHARQHGPHHAGSGRRLRRGGRRADARPRGVRRCLRARLAAGPGAQPGRAEHRLPDAAGRRGQDQPAAAELLRPVTARRAAQPRHQRHRQRQPDPAADDEPADDLAAHRRRRARHDVLDLADARAGGPGLGAAVAAADARDHEALAGTVRRAVASYGPAERADRGGLLRPRAGQGVRSAGRGREDVRRGERRALQGQLRCSVRLGADHARDDVPREPELRGDRRHRRPAGGVRLTLARGGAGVHPVHPPVHPAADHRGLDDEPPAVGGRLGRARLRAPRRRRGAGGRRR